MDFISFVIIVGFMYVVGLWAMQIFFVEKVNNPCEGLHNWHFDDKGDLRCKSCNYKALDEE